MHQHHGGFNFTNMMQHFSSSHAFGGANRTDDSLPVQDNNGIYMPAQPGLNRSSSQNDGLTEFSNMNHNQTEQTITNMHQFGQVNNEFGMS